MRAVRVRDDGTEAREWHGTGHVCGVDVCRIHAMSGGVLVHVNVEGTMDIEGRHLGSAEPLARGASAALFVPLGP